MARLARVRYRGLCGVVIPGIPHHITQRGGRWAVKVSLRNQSSYLIVFSGLGLLDVRQKLDKK